MKDYIYIGIIAALFLVFFMLHIIQSSRISKLMKRYEAFMEGKDATNLADAIEENFQQMEKLESSYQDAEVKMDKALSGITSTFHKLGIVKYDAYFSSSKDVVIFFITMFLPIYCNTTKTMIIKTAIIKLSFISIPPYLHIHQMILPSYFEYKY